VLARYEPFHQFLLKATGQIRWRAFAPPEKWRSSWWGCSARSSPSTGQPAAVAEHPVQCRARHATTEPAWADLPTPVVDPFDPAAALLTTAALAGPEQMLAALESAPRSPSSPTSSPARGSMPVTSTRPKPSSIPRGARRRVAGGVVAGVLHLANDRPEGACAFFGAVAAELPGELAPRLALAVALELSAAGPGYDGHGGITEPRSPCDSRSTTTASSRPPIRATPAPPSASPGFGWPWGPGGSRRGAAADLDLSSSHLAAQIGLCQLQCADVDGSAPTLVDLTAPPPCSASSPSSRRCAYPRARPPPPGTAPAGGRRRGRRCRHRAGWQPLRRGRPTQRDGADVAQPRQLAPTDKERCHSWTRPTTSDPGRSHDVPLVPPHGHRAVAGRLPALRRRGARHERFCEVCGSPLAGTGPTAPPSQAAVPRAEFIAGAAAAVSDLGLRRAPQRGRGGHDRGR